MSIDPRRHVALCSLGGTITAHPDDHGAGVVPGPLSSNGFAEQIERIIAGVRITEHTLAQLPSAAIDMPLICTVVKRAAQLVAEGAQAVIITTGTDTLEEVAFVLDLLWTAPAPLIVTGAMRHPGLPGADGVANVVTAVRVAISDRATNLGVAVVINDTIHSPSQVAKRHTTRVDAFTSTIGPLGEVCEGTVYLSEYRRPRLPLTVPEDAVFHPVALLRTAIGDDGRILDTLPDLGYRGLVIEAAGGGAVPPEWAPRLETVARRIPVLYTARPGSGPALRATYSGIGSEIDLQRRHLIPAGHLDGLKARLLLTLLLAVGVDPTDLWSDTALRLA